MQVLSLKSLSLAASNEKFPLTLNNIDKKTKQSLILKNGKICLFYFLLYFCWYLCSISGVMLNTSRSIFYLWCLHYTIVSIFYLSSNLAAHSVCTPANQRRLWPGSDQWEARTDLCTHWAVQQCKSDTHGHIYYRSKIIFYNSCKCF